MKGLKRFFKKNHRTIFLFLLLIFFFSFPVLLFFDSAHYMGYVAILEGKDVFANWDIYRGPVFPLLIFISNLFFGKTSSALQILTFLFYICTLLLSKKMIDKIANKNSRGRYICYVLLLILVVFNPIVFGYYHSLLTEFVAATVVIISIFISWELICETNTEEIFFSKKSLLSAMYFVIMTPTLWFLKQPYFGVVFFPLFSIFIIKIFTGKGLIVRLKIFCIVVLSLVSFFLCNFAWTKVLIKNNLSIYTERSPESVAVQQMFSAFSYFELDKQITEDRNNFYKSVKVINRSGNIKGEERIQTNQNGVITKRSVAKFLMQTLFSHPKELINSYVENYLALVNIYKVNSEDGVYYYIDNSKFLFSSCHENCVIATDITKEKSNIFFMPEEMRSKVNNYEQYLETPFLLKSILNLNKKPSSFIFSMSFLLLPFVLIFVMIWYFLKKNELDIKEKNILSLVTILLLTSFLHLLLHSLLGGIIDRYAFPVLIPTVLGYIFLIFLFLKHYFFSLRRKYKALYKII